VLSERCEHAPLTERILLKADGRKRGEQSWIQKNEALPKKVISVLLAVRARAAPKARVLASLAKQGYSRPQGQRKEAKSVGMI